MKEGTDREGGIKEGMNKRKKVMGAQEGEKKKTLGARKSTQIMKRKPVTASREYKRQE